MSTGVPFQSTVPSKSISRLITTGRTCDGAFEARGMSSFTACVITGIVMMNMISSTSMTSISGVMLMSIIGSFSPPPMLILMRISPRCPGPCSARQCAVGLRDEAHLLDAAALAGHHHATDVLVGGRTVATQVDLRLRIHHRHLLDALEERLLRGHQRRVPEDVALSIDGNVDVLGLRLRR